MLTRVGEHRHDCRPRASPTLGISRQKPHILPNVGDATRDAPQASPDALLSNLDEPNTESLVVGNYSNSLRASTVAGRFETGGNEDGYVLTSVKAVLSTVTHSAGVRARIFNRG